jgi:hypothetical protein
MKPLLAFVTLAVAGAIPAMVALPAEAQTAAPQSTMQEQSVDQNAPGSGGVSKPGTTGLPGSKAGPAIDRPSGSRAPDSNMSGTSTAPQQDQSKAPGLPGGKSGATERSPRSSAPSSDEKGRMDR